MAFANLTASPAEIKKAALVFVRPLMSDIEADAVVGKKIATSGGWIQLKTADGGVSFMPQRTTSTTYNQQVGDVDLYQDDCKYTAEINLSQIDMAVMQDLLSMDPATTGASDTLAYKAGRGLKLTEKAISILVYDKNEDPDNNSDTPDIDADGEALCILKAVASSDVPPIVFNTVQGMGKLTFTCLASKSTGAAAGIVAVQGPFDDLS